MSKDDKQQSIPQSKEAATLMSLERLIINSIQKIEDRQEALSTKKEMFDGNFNNNKDYQEATEKAKEASQKKSLIKRDIMNNDGILALADKIRDEKKAIKELKDSLSNHLKSYTQLAGTNQFEDDEGQVREIITTAKLVKRSAKFRT